MISGKIVGVCISDRKGIPKKNVGSAYLEAGLGIKEDAHSGYWHRQISLLPMESVRQMRKKLSGAYGATKSASGGGYELKEGSFAENLTTEGIDLKTLPIGTELKVGESVRLKVTQIGKECHVNPARPTDRPVGRGDHSGGCAIFRKIGDCIMPLEGIFAEVLESGTIKVGDKIEVVSLQCHSRAVPTGRQESGNPGE